jgi:glycosyltransferase involved in cell wall biosynthesis
LKEHSEILVISHKYPPSIGGMQKHCFELVQGLEAKTKVHQLIQTEGVSKIRFFMTVVRKAKKILKANPNISVIYVNDGLMAFVLTRLIGQTKVPMIATIHGLDIVFPLAFYQKWVREKLSKYAAIIAVSEATKQECLKRGLREDQVFMVKNGFEPNSGSQRNRELISNKLRSEYGFNPKGKKIIVSIGRGVRRKGFSWFIRNVVDELPEDVCYLIIGPRANIGMIKTLKSLLPKDIFNNLVLFTGLSTDELEIELAIQELSLHDRVKRINHLSYEELNALVELADISVMPNVKVEGDFEGFGLVALEAVSNGTLCVASEIEGITSAIENGKNGILVEASNKEAWLSKIRSLLQDPAQLSHLSEQYRTYNLEHSFSWKRMVDEYYNIFSSIAKKVNN